MSVLSTEWGFTSQRCRLISAADVWQQLGVVKSRISDSTTSMGAAHGQS